MQRVRITFGYDGTCFHGSQSQSGVRTVQEELNRAIQQVAPGSGFPVLAGRTDRGVHAVGQVASLDVRWERGFSALRASLDAVSPRDIVIRCVERVHDGFHARYDALWREYRYRIQISDAPPVLSGRYVWWRRTRIDDDAASAASSMFVGTHQFGAVAGSGWSQSRDADQLTRTVRSCEWLRSDRWDEDDHSIQVELRVVANGFLPQMVRNMVSAVIAVGAGRQSPTWIGDLLQGEDRRELGEAAPPHGLTLWRVEYGDDVPVARAESQGKHEEIEW